jgi:hypothetical protein
MPYRFAHGARPFVDETTVAQQAALLVYPFVWIFNAFRGADGLVLYVRNLDFVFALLVGGAVVHAFRRLIGSTTAALLLGACVVAFAPFDIHSLSYNTIGGGLFTAGCVLGLATLNGGRRGWLVAAGLCHGLAVFAYPTLALPVAACFLCRLALTPARWRVENVGYGVPAAVVTLGAFGAVVAEAGLHEVSNAYHRSSRYLGHGGNPDRLVDVFRHEWAVLHFWYLLFPALALLALVWFRRRRLAPLLLAPLPILVLPASLFDSFDAPRFTATLEYVTSYGALGLPLAVLVWRRAGAQRLFVAVWVPSLVGGFATAYTSNNGFVNFGIGFFPAVFVTTTFLVWAFEDSLRGTTIDPAPWAAAALPVLLVVLGWQVYRDSPLPQLTTAVESGAYAGLRTSENKVLYLESLQRDLDRVGADCRIVFFKDFPGGYLLTRARSDTSSAWITTVDPAKTEAYQQTFVRYWRKEGFPDVAVVTRRIPFDPRRTSRAEHYFHDTPLATLLRTSYEPIATRFNYVMYERRDSTCRIAPAPP